MRKSAQKCRQKLSYLAVIAAICLLLALLLQATVAMMLTSTGGCEIQTRCDRHFNNCLLSASDDTD
jgi:hypothetical protein